MHSSVQRTQHLPLSTRIMRGTAAFVLLGVSFVACNKDEGIQYDQYNATNDTLTLQVGTETVLDPVEISLMSSTGQVEVGLARVDPGGGPIGTNHDFVIEVYDEFQDVVDRASVRLKSPGRGEDEYDLEQDSADEGYYKTILESVGDAGEVRTDTFLVRVWQIESGGTDGTDSTDGTGGS